PIQHRLASLTPAAPLGLALARAEGLPVLDAPPPERLWAAMDQADIVQLHFWNTPELYALLRAPWPATRLIVWVHVGGASAPQVLTPELSAFGDVLVPGCELCAELPVLNAPGAAPSVNLWNVSDLEALEQATAVPRAGFNVGYLGTVDGVKMHA